MAAATKPTSAWVSSYSDKKDEWVLARLEFLENNERISLAGSLPRRREIRLLRVELLNRKKDALAAAEALNGATGPALNGTAPTGPLSAVSKQEPQGQQVRR